MQRDCGFNISATRRRAARWRDHDAGVPFALRAASRSVLVDAEAIDLTGDPACLVRAALGKPISWRTFAAHTGRPIPLGAVSRTRRPRWHHEPQLPLYWIGRLCRFPKRYTDPSRENRGLPRRPVAAASAIPMAALLRPLSARAKARHHAWTTVPAKVLRADNDNIQRRSPLSEEHQAGRISSRHMNGLDWFMSEVQFASSAQSDGVRMRTHTGAMAPSGSRDPFALWLLEAAADRSVRLRLRFRTLGPLARIIVQAFNGAEMADLAPAWPFPRRHIAEAGRVRLRAGLELCARMSEREVDRLPPWEVLEVAKTACAECSALESSRRMRVLVADNDNMPKRKAA